MKILIPKDFREFLKLLRTNEVEYLLIGGYAVGFYGYARPTADLDVWVARSRRNAEKIVAALKQFGFASPALSVELFTREKAIVRMGVAPFRLEMITFIDGVDFSECYEEKQTVKFEETEVDVIGLKHLKINKKASGRLKDLNDLENLP